MVRPVQVSEYLGLGATICEFVHVIVNIEHVEQPSLYTICFRLPSFRYRYAYR